MVLDAAPWWCHHLFTTFCSKSRDWFLTLAHASVRRGGENQQIFQHCGLNNYPIVQHTMRSTLPDFMQYKGCQLHSFNVQMQWICEAHLGKGKVGHQLIAEKAQSNEEGWR